jgi:hypothetical protein
LAAFRINSIRGRSGTPEFNFDFQGAGKIQMVIAWLHWLWREHANLKV